MINSIFNQICRSHDVMLLTLPEISLKRRSNRGGRGEGHEDYTNSVSRLPNREETIVLQSSSSFKPPPCPLFLSQHGGESTQLGVYTTIICEHMENACTAG